MKNIINSTRALDFGKEISCEIYDDLNTAASKLDSFFANELRSSITIDRLLKIINREVANVKVQILALINKDKDSRIFTLSSDKQKIIYTPQRADEKRLFKHEAELILKLSKEGHTVVKEYLLKGKYLNMYINYETKKAFLENDIRALKYAIANPELISIKLLEDIYGHNEKVKLSQRKLDINLNGHSLHIDNITIVDSEIRIVNGELYCCKDLCKWKLKNNEYNFIWIKKSKNYTSLELESVFVNEKNLNHLSGELRYKDVNLIGCYLGKGKLQVDRIMLSRCSFKLKTTTNACETYILNSNAKENIIIKNDFYDSNRVLQFKGREEPVRVHILGNSFRNLSSRVRNIITVVPDKASGYVSINGVKIESAINMEILKLMAIEAGEALLDIKKEKLKNDFDENCSIDIYVDERGSLIKSIKFQEGRWGEKVPPRLIPDRINNDMQHYIRIGFRPLKQWSDNITKIIVLNSRGRVLNREQYHIDGINGVITIFNVFFHKDGRPYFKGLLEPGINYIMIKAEDFEDNWVCQVIRPIQVIEVKKGIGKAVTQITDEGLYKLSAAVISNGRKIVLDRPVEIKIR